MTTYAVTGATGHLGPLAIDQLLARGVAPGDVVAIARTPARAADLAARGVNVRQGDYSRPETLPAALAGVDRLLLVSGSDVGRRVPQHTAVIEAARAAGVQRILYTSIPRADASPFADLAAEHAATEAVLRASGVAYTILRNSSYHENYTGQLDQYVATGVILGATDDAPISGASRADLAEAAAVVLLTDGHENATYELGGPTFTLTDLAAAITEVTGTTVVHRNLDPAELLEAYRGFGLEEAFATYLVGLDRGTAAGGWHVTTGDLERLLGRPPASIADSVRAARG